MKGKQEGYGTYTWKDGRKYEGNFAGGKQHGIGMFCGATGDKKKGRWEQGKRVAWIDENGNEITEKKKEHSSVTSAAGPSSTSMNV